MPVRIIFPEPDKHFPKEDYYRKYEPRIKLTEAIFEKYYDLSGRHKRFRYASNLKEGADVEEPTCRDFLQQMAVNPPSFGEKYLKRMCNDAIDFYNNNRFYTSFQKKY